MPDELPEWIDADPDDAPTPPRRSRLLRVAALVPWAAIAALVLVGHLGADDHTDPDHTDRTAVAGVSTMQDGDSTSDSSAQPPAPQPGGSPSEDNQPEPTTAAVDPNDPALIPLSEHGLVIDELRGRWRLGPEDGDAAALAVAVARSWLTGIEPRLELGDLTPVTDHTYVEHLVVEAVERPQPDAAVVSLLAVLLDRHEDTTEVRAARLAVPIAFVDDTVRPAGIPWWTTPPDLRPVELSRTPVEDPADLLDAVEALALAGFSDVELHTLEQTTGWPFIATLEATAPDGSTLDGEVWLRRHLEGFVVAGASLRPAEPAGATIATPTPPASDDQEDR